MTVTGTNVVATFSIRNRFFVALSVVLVFGLGGIGWTVDRMYARSVQDGIIERLTATLNLLVSTIEETGGELVMQQPLDSRLQQPGSNLTAGMQTDYRTWLSASTLQVAPLEWPHGPQGEQVYRRIDEFFPDANPQLVMSWELGWESDRGEVLPLHLWAAADVAELREPLAEFRRDTWRWLSMLGILLVCVQLVTGWLGMKPLRRVEGEILAIERGEKQSLDGAYPVELSALTENLNALLASERIGQQQYRKALGNLGHAMKTPLAVISSILQQPALDSDDMEQANNAVQELHSVIRFQIERAASAARRTMVKPVMVAIQAERIVRSLKKIYPHVSIIQDIEHDCLFFGEQRDLLEVLGNLLENACKYGSGDVLLRVLQLNLNKRKPGLRISVGNSGNPLDRDQFEKMLQRGLRGDERVDGDGLGLAIVAEIAEAYGASLSADISELGGLQVILEFP